MITNEEYEKFVDDVWLGTASQDKYEQLRELFIMTTGLGGEAGEVQEKLKKYIRDGNLDRGELAKELGDVLYYLTKIAHTFGFTLRGLMVINRDKLQKRIDNNTMRGSGDNR